MERVRVALEKRRAGQLLSTREVNLIRRFERRREEQQRRALFSRVPQKDMIELFGRQTKTLLAWEEAGLPVHRFDGRVYYDLYEFLPWFERHLLGADSTGDSKRAAEIRLLVRREAALQMKMQIMAGELVHREDVERGRCERIKMVRSGLDALRRTLAPAMLELSPDATLSEAEALVSDYTEAILKAFAGQTRGFIGPDGLRRARIIFPSPGKGQDEAAATKQAEQTQGQV